MRAGEVTIGAFLVGVLAVVCCAGPPLVAAIGTTVLAAWLSKSAYVLVPAAVIAAGIGAVRLYHRGFAARDCHPPKISRRPAAHE